MNLSLSTTILLTAIVLAPPPLFAQNAGRGTGGAQPLNYDAIAGRIVSYRGREVVLQGQLKAITETRNGPVLTVLAKGRTVYVLCAEAPSVKVNEPIAMIARIPATASLQYLEFVKLYSDEDEDDTGGVEIDLSRVKFDDEGELKMLEMVNDEREKARLKPFKWNGKLQTAARKHCADMVLNNFSSHNSKNGDTVAKRVAAEGVTYGGVGENLATSSSVANAHKGLMDSPGHRSNIMSKDFTDIGIGIAKTPDGTVVVTQNFIYKH